MAAAIAAAVAPSVGQFGTLPESRLAAFREILCFHLLQEKEQGSAKEALRRAIVLSVMPSATLPP